MHTFSETDQTGRHIFSCALCLACILATAVQCHADIYRFVTVDGVESFTDAPLNKGAKVVIKEHVKTPKRQDHAKAQKVHNVSLDEIVEKTVNASVLMFFTGQDLSRKPLIPCAVCLTQRDWNRLCRV